MSIIVNCQALQPSPPSSEAAAIIPLSKMGDGLAPLSTSQAPSIGGASVTSLPGSVAERASTVSAPERSGVASTSNANKAGPLRNGRSNSGGPLGSTNNSAARRKSSDPGAQGGSKGASRAKPAAPLQSASTHARQSASDLCLHASLPTRCDA